ncbi:MAG: FtsQ-type POTRA domain-containing protein [Candidatus Latescibacterota bacterium]
MAIDRTKKQKRKATRAMIKRLLAAFVVSAVILSSLYLYNYLTSAEWLRVEEIELEGVSRINPVDLEKMLGDVKGQNIFLVSLDSYTARIADHPRVRFASLKRVLPNRVVCTVEEREPVALIFDGRFLEVDESGMIMGEDHLSPLLDLPIVTGIPGKKAVPGKNCQDKRLLDALNALLFCKRYGGRFAEEISELRVWEGGITITSLQENSTLLLGASDYENQLHKYFVLKKSIASEERSAKIIDLRFKDQIVLRNKL